MDTRGSASHSRTHTLYKTNVCSSSSPLRFATMSYRRSASEATGPIRRTESMATEAEPRLRLRHAGSSNLALNSARRKDPATPFRQNCRRPCLGEPGSMLVAWWSEPSCHPHRKCRGRCETPWVHATGPRVAGKTGRQMQLSPRQPQDLAWANLDTIE